MDEDKEANPTAQEANPAAQGGCQSREDVDITGLSSAMEKCFVWVDMTLQVVPCEEGKNPPFTVPVDYNGEYYAIFVGVNPLVDVVARYGARTQDPKYKARPSVDDSKAMWRACHAMAVKDYAREFAGTERKILSHTTKPSKTEVLMHASRLRLIPEETKLSDESTNAKGGRGGGKAATKPKSSGGLVDAKAADGAVVDMRATAAAVQKAKKLLKSVRDFERANQKLAKAVAAAGVGEGKAAVSDKETMVSGGDAAVVLDKAKVSGGDAAVRPSAGGAKGGAGGKEPKGKGKGGAAAVAVKDDDDVAGGGGGTAAVAVKDDDDVAGGGGGTAAVAVKDDDDVAGVGKRARSQ
jgi:hypothetical protein